RRFVGWVDRVVATSPNYQASSDVLQRFRDKVSVIPIGLDRGRYPPPDEARAEAWRRRFGGRYFLFVGVIRYYKGLLILLEAARGTDFPIVIVGTGPSEQELRRRAAEMGIENVHFLGFLPEADKVAALQARYGIVFPSHLRAEAFGVSHLEGAMFGKL